MLPDFQRAGKLFNEEDKPMSNIKYRARGVSEINYQGPYTITSSAPKNFSVTVRNVPNTSHADMREREQIKSVQKDESSKR